MIVKVVDQYMCGQGELMIEPRQNAAHAHARQINPMAQVTDA